MKDREVKRKRDQEMEEDHLMLAVMAGDLRQMKRMLSAGVTSTESHVRMASEQGHSEVLRLLLEHGATTSDESLCAAAERGHLTCIQHLLLHGMYISDAAICAAVRFGRIECVKYMQKFIPKERKVVWESDLVNDDNIECFIFAFHHIFDPARTNLRSALLYDNVTSLDYGHARGLPLPDYLLRCSGGFDSFVRLHELGCPWTNHLCTLLASRKNSDYLRYAHSNGCPWNGRDVANEAARAGAYDCLKYAREHGCPWGVDTCRLAAQRGHLECLEYLHRNKCLWDSTVTVAAARASLIIVRRDDEPDSVPFNECLRYAHENGCPWDEMTCAISAGSITVEHLKYAHENGCPWDFTVCMTAARQNRLACLQYAHENGCPWNARVFAVAKVDSDCEKYLIEHGCPRL